MLYAPFPYTRLRRLRQQPWLREMLSETRLHSSDLVLPLFVHEDSDPATIASLPHVFRHSLSSLIAAAKEAYALGIPAIALFPVVAPERKSDDGREALNKDNLICRAIKAVKNAVPEIGIIADVALDPYTTHGHDGLVENGDVANDATVKILAQQALVLTAAGADIIAPSDMMDGRVAAIRAALEQHNFANTLILSYAAKYASALYGPFRDAVGSAQAYRKSADERAISPRSGASWDAQQRVLEATINKGTYQMNSANADEAMREIAMDIAEGADMVMVKPASLYLDIIHRAASTFNVPVFAYHVSGEYAMAHAMPNAEAILMESLLAIKRAGARAILTYAALDVAKNIT